MNFNEMCRIQDNIVEQSRSTTDPTEKEKLTHDFFDVAIDFWNENMTGDIALADGRTVFIPAIEN